MRTAILAVVLGILGVYVGTKYPDKAQELVQSVAQSVNQQIRGDEEGEVPNISLEYVLAGLVTLVAGGLGLRHVGAPAVSAAGDRWMIKSAQGRLIKGTNLPGNLAWKNMATNGKATLKDILTLIGVHERMTMAKKFETPEHSPEFSKAKAKVDKFLRRTIAACQRATDGTGKAWTKFDSVTSAERVRTLATVLTEVRNELAGLTVANFDPSKA